jgi:hypothetical protein
MTENLTVVVSYDIKRRLWLAAVMEGNTVLTLGYETTEAEARAWGEKAKERRAWGGRGRRSARLLRPHEAGPAPWPQLSNTKTKQGRT